MSKILTHSGKMFDLLNPHHQKYEILDIAHALSNLCRFTGHCDDFYSVAQHSVIVSHLVPEKDALAALLHDASEAYMGDVSSPLKALLEQYRFLEGEISASLLRSFGLSPDLPESVHMADKRALATELRDLMPHYEPWDGIHGVSPLHTIIAPLPPQEAKDLFLNRYYDIVTGSNQPLGLEV